MPASWLEPWHFIVAIVVVLAIIAFFVFRKSKRAEHNPAALRQEAYREASQALAAIGQASTRDAAIRASHIFRKYLSVAANDPALFETHEETLARGEALKDFSEETRSSVKAGFNRLAALKYAAEVPSLPVSEITTEFSQLLETLHRSFRA